MNFHVKILLWCLTLFVFIQYSECSYCSNIKRHMGTKNLPAIFTDKANPIKISDECELQQLYLVSRHGK
jgi:hypothetical protein